MTTTQAHKILQGSFSKDKHQILWERGVNYAKLGEREKKGSILIREVQSAVDFRYRTETDPRLHTPQEISVPLEALSFADDTSPEGDDHSTDPSTSSTPCAFTFEHSADGLPPKKLTNRKLLPKKGKNRQPLLPFDGTSGKVVVLHVDLIKDAFWAERPWLLA